MPCPRRNSPRVLAAACGLLLAGLAVSGVDAFASDDDGEGASKPKAVASHPLEALFDERKFQDVILAADKQRTTAPGGKLDAESSYWVAMAQARLKQTDAARDSFLALSKAFPESPRAADAGIEAAIRLVDRLDAEKRGGRINETQAQALAAQAATEAEAVAAAVPDDAARAARALYVAGNCWRLAKDDKKATADYEACRVKYATDEYGAKSAYILAAMAGGDLRPDDARRLLSECALKWKDTATASRCAKNLNRLDVVGTPAPALNAQAWFGGPPVDLAALHGKVVLVWFFATWCPHCKATMPEIAALKTRMAGQPFEIVGFTHNTKTQTTEIAAAFVKEPEWGITYPVGVDQPSGTTSNAFQSLAIPSAVLIDKKGVVRWADHPVYLTDDLIKRLLAE